MNKRTDIVFWDGALVAKDEVRISPWDRGFLFGESLYEVIPTLQGQLFLAKEHIDRLLKGLRAVDIASPYTKETWLEHIEALLKAVDTETDVLIYCQITRGVHQKRAHTLLETSTPTVVMFSTPYKPVLSIDALPALKAITQADTRWAMCHIKTTNLLANTLLAQKANSEGSNEALLIRDGFVTEGTKSNVFMIKNNRIMTPVADHRILPGITRDLVFKLAEKASIPCEEAECTVTDLTGADEIFITSSSQGLMPVTVLDNKPVGLGAIGPVMKTLFTSYQNYIKKTLG